jgi:hypothetical protein
LVTYQFTDTIIKLESYYYLSDSIEQKFDSLKIGKNQNGKYIIGKNKSYIGIFEIINLDEENLSIKNVRTKVELNFKKVK